MFYWRGFTTSSSVPLTPNASERSSNASTPSSRGKSPRPLSRRRQARRSPAAARAPSSNPEDWKDGLRGKTNFYPRPLGRADLLAALGAACSRVKGTARRLYGDRAESERHQLGPLQRHLRRTLSAGDRRRWLRLLRL